MKNFGMSFFAVIAIFLESSSALAMMKKFEFLNCYKSAVYAMEAGWGVAEAPSGQKALKDLGMLTVVASTRRGITASQVAQYRKAIKYSRDCQSFLEVALAGVQVPTLEDHDKVGLCSHQEMPFRKILMELKISTTNLLSDASLRINHLQEALHIEGTRCQDIDARLKFIAIETLKDQYSEVQELYDDLQGISRR